jgi:acid phosphatase type 7
MVGSLVRHALLCLIASLTACGGADGIGGPVAGEHYDPEAVLLTWRRDPTTTMVVDWHTTGDDGAGLQLRFRRAGALTWTRVGNVDRHPFPFSMRTIHRVELSGLRPDTDYEFRIGRHGRVYRFRTLPRSLTRPVRFLAGGDMLGGGDSEQLERLGRAGMAYDVDFAVVAGDLAYADGRADRVGRWYTYLEAYRQTFMTAHGRLVPIVHAVGNHDVAGGYWFNHESYEPTDAGRRDIAPFFLALLAFPGQPGYGVLDVGDYLSIVVLDSDHIGPIAGPQSAWLEQVLAQRSARPHVFPVYHIPAYPSVRPFDGLVNTRIRDHWVPSFERHQVRVVFEAHDHAYKRSHPVRNGAVDPAGVVYLGDGAWGVAPRDIGSQQPAGHEAWYLDRAEAVAHVIVATITARSAHFLVFGDDHRVIDELHIGLR